MKKTRIGVVGIASLITTSTLETKTLNQIIKDEKSLKITRASNYEYPIKDGKQNRRERRKTRTNN